MITCDKEINLWLEKIKKGVPIYSLRPIKEYIECAKKKDLDARYFPVVNSGFIVYQDTTIFLTAEDGGTKLTLEPLRA